MRTLQNLRKIQLPVVDANESLALVQQLLNAATGETLPASVSVALADVSADRDALQAVIGAETNLEDVPGVRTIDIVEDAAWGIVRDFLAVWGRLPEELPEGVQARHALQRLFGDTGLEFTQERVVTEAAIGDTKLGVVKAEKLDDIINSLGGAVILKHLIDTHGEYHGAIAAAQESASAEAPQIQKAFESIKDAMELYIAKVVGSVERGKPETAAVAIRLLSPIDEWKAATKKAKREAKPTEIVAPVKPS